MMRHLVWPAAVLLASGCGFESTIFPDAAPPSLFPEPPAALGPYGFSERRVELEDAGDGRPGGITLFEPVGASGVRPVLVWVMGVNNRAHFHQSFHEYMASWGYVEIVPDTRDLSFTDFNYHGRNTALAKRALDLALSGELGVQIDPDRLALGGYSVGASMAAFVAADRPQVRALALWAPSPAPLWLGVDPRQLLPEIRQPCLFLLAELDDVTPADEWPAEMQRLMINSPQTVEVIPQGVHLFFQQPGLVDDRNPDTSITRVEQMRQALELTRAYLDTMMDVLRPADD